MRRCVLVAAVAVCAAGIGVADDAVNFVRGDLTGDNIGGVLHWRVTRDKGGVQVERLKESGPDGTAAWRISGGRGASFTFDHSISQLVVGEPYRISAWVRSHALGGEKKARYLVYNDRWSWSGSAWLPEDTQGAWREVSWEGNLGETLFNQYVCSFHFTGLPEGAYVDISHPRLTALSEKGRRESKPCPQTKPYAPRIVPFDPLLSKVDADDAAMAFAYTGDLDDAPERYLLTAETAGKTVTLPLGKDGRTKAVFGKIPVGTQTLKVSLRHAANERPLAENVYEIVASRPVSETAGRRLNNFVTELYRGELKNGPVTFSLARDGWVYVAFDRAFTNVLADVDGIRGAVRYRAGESSHTMRYLKAGSHVVTVGGVSPDDRGRMTIRKVKLLVQGLGHAFMNLDIGMYGRYTVDFCRKMGLFEYMNTPDVDLCDIKSHPEIKADFLDRGMQILEHLGIGSEAAIRNDLWAYKNKFKTCPGWLDERPIVVDENSMTADPLMKYNNAETLWDVGRGNHRIDFCLCGVQSGGFGPARREVSDMAAMINSGYGTSCIWPETYPPMPDDLKKVEAVKDYYRTFVRSARAIVPDYPSHVCYLLGGWVWPGVYNPWFAPEGDMKAFYDDFLHMLATEPDFADIGGTGLSTPACDEGLFRFMMHAFWHYCVKGSTERLSDAYGLKMFPGILDNGDFMEGFRGWTPCAVEPGSIALGKREGFGKDIRGQLRMYYEIACGGPVRPFGDDYAVFTKCAAGVNRLTHPLVGLTPGRLYEVTYCTYGLDDIEQRKGSAAPKRMIAAAVEGGEEIPELRYACSEAKGKTFDGHVSVVTQRIVFRARGEQATLVLSDDGVPAPVGVQRAVNYVGARPYFVRNEKDLATLSQVGAQSPRGLKDEAR